MTFTPAQLALWQDLQNLSKVEQELYHSRSHFRLKDNEFVHVPRRITLTFEDKVTVQDRDMDGESWEYETNREEEFYYHVWFNLDGHIWFLISEDLFPTFGKDIAYWSAREEYDIRRCGRGSRYYFFQDIIDHAVRDAVQARWEGLHCHYVWKFSDLDVITYKEEIPEFWNR